MTTVLLSIILIAICMVGLGLGVLFFNKEAAQGQCAKPPQEDPEQCLSREAGLCPIEDTSGALKMQHRSRLSFHKRSQNLFSNPKSEHPQKNGPVKPETPS